MTQWLVVPNWDRFQHYKNRNPVWIKAYPELLSDDAYLGLTFHQRGVLHGIWMEYARAHRQLPDSTLTVSRRLGDRVPRRTLDALIHAGFLEVSASRPLAPRYQDASPEVEVEKKPPNPLIRGREKPHQNGPAPPRYPCPECGLLLRGPQAVQEHVEHVHW